MPQGKWCAHGRKSNSNHALVRECGACAVQHTSRIVEEPWKPSFSTPTKLLVVRIGNYICTDLSGSCSDV